MRKAIGTSLALVFVPALAVVLLASREPEARQYPESGFSLAGTIEMSSSENGLQTVVTIVPPISGKSLQAFVVRPTVPTFIRYSGSASLSFKPGVLSVQTDNDGGWQFSVQREGIFVPKAAASAVRVSVVGITSYRANLALMAREQWTTFLLGKPMPQTSKTATDVISQLMSEPATNCIDTAPEGCDGGGPGATGCSYSCNSTSCSSSCSSGFYACCFCVGVARCGCCRNE